MATPLAQRLHLGGPWEPLLQKLVVETCDDAPSWRRRLILATEPITVQQLRVITLAMRGVSTAQIHARTPGSARISRHEVESLALAAALRYTSDDAGWDFPKPGTSARRLVAEGSPHPKLTRPTPTSSPNSGQEVCLSRRSVGNSVSPLRPPAASQPRRVRPAGMASTSQPISAGPAKTTASGSPEDTSPPRTGGKASSPGGGPSPSLDGPRPRTSPPAPTAARTSSAFPNTRSNTPGRGPSPPRFIQARA